MLSKSNSTWHATTSGCSTANLARNEINKTSTTDVINIFVPLITVFFLFYLLLFVYKAFDAKRKEVPFASDKLISLVNFF